MDAVYLVFASKDGESELWAASGAPAKALAAVRKHLPPGWLLTLTGESWPTEEASSLGVSPGGIRRLSGVFLNPGQRQNAELPSKVEIPDMLA